MKVLQLIPTTMYNFHIRALRTSPRYRDKLPHPAILAVIRFIRIVTRRIEVS